MSMSINEKKELGRKSRKKGDAFENIVRADLESKGWIVSKWNNQVDLENNKLIPAKAKYNPFLKRVIRIGTGWPDFIAYRLTSAIDGELIYEVIGVECKTNGYLDKIERDKSKWLLDNNIFSMFIIARKTKVGKDIIYKEFEGDDKCDVKLAD